jgi:hypothetical protein
MSNVSSAVIARGARAAARPGARMFLADETPDRNARSGSRFMAVSARSDSAYEVPVPSRCQRARQAASVRFHTTRTQPDVRASSCCCAWSG